jgi:uncharacterized protein YoaH (UPF0181 family)
MIDPLTALSIASTAVSQIQQLLSAGRDASSAIAKFAGAVSDINYAAERAKNPSIWKSLTGSAEAEAIEIFTAQKRVQEMRQQIETMIGYTYGESGLNEYKETLRRVKKQREHTAYRKQEIKEALLVWTIGSLAVLAGIAGLAALIYFLGVQQGKW